jgi:hypothetical protein
MRASTAVRLLVKSAVLTTTWFHAHWSVALSLTVLALESEVNAFTQDDPR